MIAMLAALQLAGAAAQVSAAESIATEPCQVERVAPDLPFAGKILFTCWSRALVLGEAENFSSAYYSESRTTAIVIEGRWGTKVLLITPSSNDVPHIDNVTADLAKLAGRYVEAGIAGLQVDLSVFAAQGTLALSSESSVEAKASAWSGTQAGVPPMSGTRYLDARLYASRAAQIANEFNPPAASTTETLAPATAN